MSIKGDTKELTIVGGHLGPKMWPKVSTIIHHRGNDYENMKIKMSFIIMINKQKIVKIAPLDNFADLQLMILVRQSP